MLTSLRHFIVTRNSVPELILNDLIAKILDMLDYRDLALACKCVRRAPFSSLLYFHNWAPESQSRWLPAFKLADSVIDLI